MGNWTVKGSIFMHLKIPERVSSLSFALGEKWALQSVVLSSLLM